ncbi:hypothetical protein CPB85DRAFT_1301523 [Mucidula mucida]|nr:hypothetical protein CPB85DRAFT_1301523 [Mucidula mucida]
MDTFAARPKEYQIIFVGEAAGVTPDSPQPPVQSNTERNPQTMLGYRFHGQL